MKQLFIFAFCFLTVCMTQNFSAQITPVITHDMVILPHRAPIDTNDYEVVVLTKKDAKILKDLLKSVESKESKKPWTVVWEEHKAYYDSVEKVLEPFKPHERDARRPKYQAKLDSLWNLFHILRDSEETK